MFFLLSNLGGGLNFVILKMKTNCNCGYFGVYLVLKALAFTEYAEVNVTIINDQRQ